MTDSEKNTIGVDVFAKVPAFLAAFNDILENGFFQEISFNVRASDNGKISFCMISAEGYIPSSAEYNADGCGEIIIPKEIIMKCREVTNANKVKNLEAKVETKDWLLCDDEGENIVGSKGQNTRMSLTIIFSA